MDISSVITYIRRKYEAQPKRRKQIEHMFQHANHVLQKLTSKRISLFHGIRSLKRNSEASIEACASLSTQTKIPALQSLIQHWFIQYLRLRDGFVLLQSGECRHKPDQVSSTKTRFPSKLTSNKTRADGYTTLFSASHYSGFGWDEFYDEERGVKSRLCLLLLNGKKRDCSEIWDRWTSRFPILGSFEEKLDHHETSMRQLADDLEVARKKFLRCIEENILAQSRNSNKIKIHMSTKDKFECLEIMISNKNGQETSLRMERQGNDFRISDKDGVLPGNWMEKEWDKIMKWQGLRTYSPSKEVNTKTADPSSGISQARNVKLSKRRVIDDDSDDSDTENSTKRRQLSHGSSSKSTSNAISLETSLNGKENLPSKSGPGIKIQMKTHSDNKNLNITGNNPIQAGHDSVTTSLTAIKLQLGVDDKLLQTSREFVENEQRETSREVVKDLLSDELSRPVSVRVHENEENLKEMMEEISQVKEEFLHYKQNYKDIMHNQKDKERVDDVESWDARECLRQSSMHLGNLYLNVSRQLQPSRITQEIILFLQKAQSKFHYAMDIIKEQNEAHHNTMTSIHSRAVLKRNLLLLEGRALSNLAITLIEQAELKKKLLSEPPILTNPQQTPINSTESISDLLQRAIRYLERAEDCSRSLFAQITISHSQNENSYTKEDVEVDKMECFELEYLVCRWLAIALWGMKKYNKAIEMLQKKASVERNVSNHVEDNNNSLLSSIHILVERYICAVLIIDLVSSTPDMRKKDVKTEGEIVSICCKCFRLAATLSESIVEKTNKSRNDLSMSEIRQKYDIEESQNLLREAQEMEETWKERKERGVKNRSKNLNNPLIEGKWASADFFLPKRNELVGNNPVATGPPARQINSSFTNLRRHHLEGNLNHTASSMIQREIYNNNRNRGKIEGDFSTFSSEMGSSELSSSNHVISQITYRKWGDQLLPEAEGKDKESNMSTTYPSCAPERTLPIPQ